MGQGRVGVAMGEGKGAQEGGEEGEGPGLVSVLWARWATMTSCRCVHVCARPACPDRPLPSSITLSHSHLAMTPPTRPPLLPRPPPATSCACSRQAEVLLDSFALEFAGLASALLLLTQEIEATEDYLQFRLNSARNKLIRSGRQGSGSRV